MPGQHVKKSELSCAKPGSVRVSGSTAPLDGESPARGRGSLAIAQPPRLRRRREHSRVEARRPSATRVPSGSRDASPVQRDRHLPIRVVHRAQSSGGIATAAEATRLTPRQAFARKFRVTVFGERVFLSLAQPSRTPGFFRGARQGVRRASPGCVVEVPPWSARPVTPP